MSAVTTVLPPRAAYTDEPIFRLTVDQYHDLIERGKLTSDDPVELIEGMLVFKMPKYPPRATVTGCLADLITPALPKGWFLRTQEPITLNDGEPEPDATIIRGRRRDYSTRHPGPDEIGLVVEVADSTLKRDRGMKLRSYARAGIICYWIINLIDQQIEVYTQPDAKVATPTYLHREIVPANGQFNLVLDGRPITKFVAADMLPAVSES